jgi:phosphatidylserine decarboxylase
VKDKTSYYDKQALEQWSRRTGEMCISHTVSSNRHQTVQFINNCIVYLRTRCISEADGRVVSLGTRCVSEADGRVVSLGTHCISEADGRVFSLGTRCISEADGHVVSLGTLCRSQAVGCIVYLKRMDGNQHISTKINILWSLQQDFVDCLLEGRHLLHYRHEKIKYRRHELVCDYYVHDFKTGVLFTSANNFKRFLLQINL